MSLVFGHLVNELCAESFKDTEFESISEREFQVFLKEFVFDKLQNKKLGKTFSEKFGIQDRVLSIFYEDEDAIQHIRYCKYVR